MNKNEPKYYIIKKELVKLINEGGLKKGEQVPSETKLMDRYNVSRITARRALEDLTNEGYLYKVQGKGCFVRQDSNSQSLSKIHGYTEEIEKLDMKVSRKILEIGIIPCFYKRSKELCIDIDDELFVLKRIYYADNIPLCLTTAYLPYKYFKGIEMYDFSSNSLYKIIEKKYMINIVRSNLKIEAVSADENISKELDIKKGTPLILFRSVTYGLVKGKEIPIEYFKTYYNTNNIHYSLEQIR